MADLKESPSQTAGPYVHIGCVPTFAGLEGMYGGKDLGDRMITGDPAGERITLRLRVIDAAGDAMTDAMIEGYMDGLPVMADEDRLILVETEIDYEEPFGVGLKTTKFNTMTFANPRHLRVCFNNTPEQPGLDAC